MAQLKDTVVQGNLRATDSLVAAIGQFKCLQLPSTSGSASYGVGSSGQVARSNGTSVYWGSVTDNSSATAVTSSDTNLITGRTLYYAGYLKVTDTINSSTSLMHYEDWSSSLNYAHPNNSSHELWPFKGTVLFHQCTGSTDASTRPGSGHVLHFLWNDTTPWDAQLYIPNQDRSNDTVYWRAVTTNSTSPTPTWGSWRKLAEVEGSYSLKVSHISADGNPTNVTVEDTYNSVSLQARLEVGTGHQNHGLYSNGYAVSAGTVTSSGKWIIYRGSDGEAHTQLKLYGAVWNDYAEYRNYLSENKKPGLVYQENDNGTLTLTKERLVPGAGIHSDTFGFAIGKQNDKQIPIAVSGRVLAYPYQDRTKYHAGMCVCSAPDGKIDIMTREEIIMYPDAIIGIVSEIPEYKYWGEDNINVDNRIWIKVR